MKGLIAEGRCSRWIDEGAAASRARRGPCPPHPGTASPSGERRQGRGRRPVGVEYGSTAQDYHLSLTSERRHANFKNRRNNCSMRLPWPVPGRGSDRCVSFFPGMMSSPPPRPKPGSWRSSKRRGCLCRSRWPPIRIQDRPMIDDPAWLPQPNSAMRIGRRLVSPPVDLVSALLDRIRAARPEKIQPSFIMGRWVRMRFDARGPRAEEGDRPPACVARARCNAVPRSRSRTSSTSPGPPDDCPL